MDSFGDMEVIFSYTRAQALEDGELVDVSEWASADKGFFGGFVCPVAMTRHLYNVVEAIPSEREGVEDIRGRAHDVLFMGSLALRSAMKLEETSTKFQVILPTQGSNQEIKDLWISLHGGDEGETVVTIGFPEDF